MFADHTKIYAGHENRTRDQIQQWHTLPLHQRGNKITKLIILSSLVFRGLLLIARHFIYVCLYKVK